MQTPAAMAATVDSNIKRLVLVTDAWDPQINGVVRTLKTTAKELQAMGLEVHLITPQVRQWVNGSGHVIWLEIWREPVDAPPANRDGCPRLRQQISAHASLKLNQSAPRF